MAFIELRSFNVPDHFIRHRNFLGELTRKEGAPDDFQFALVRRGQGVVALRSKNFPDRFLRHRDFRIHLEQASDPNPQLFGQDTSFRRVRGLADPHGVSYESVNVPGHFLRHRDFHLFLDQRESPNLAPDATFFEQAAPVAIDTGTNLVPAPD